MFFLSAYAIFRLAPYVLSVIVGFFFLFFLIMATIHFIVILGSGLIIAKIVTKIYNHYHL